MRIRRKNQIVWAHVRAGRRQRPDDLNIMPIMNLLIILIPFLLVSVSFVELAVVHSALSEIAAAASQDELKASLIVEISPEGYKVSSRSIDLAKLLKQGQVVAGKGGFAIATHNRDELSKTLQRVKSYFPNEKSISIAPRPSTNYQLVIRTMDSIREYRDKSGGLKPLFPNMAFIKLKASL